MKKVVLVLSFVLVTVLVYGQESEAGKSTYPYWTISKDIQKFQLKDYQFTPATVQTGSLVWVQSKPVASTYQQDKDVKPAKVVMTGTPASVISKDVARMQYERNKRKN
ncbi:hypothetical protein [Chryseosolibacter indicus]|uniref:DUF5666 domain-containing protein n=1 Tax=Chryseosolibacter indicus TaxID=2782351 RepID=A0ABS5VR19_9BACT|nr:hypothetical protein [Chryseosolibacter indicus]MBT1703601.1 hypothetical protein [Chryseosolibacter indicus]